MNSIIEQDNGRCYLCGRYNATDTHHIFPGSYRANSDRYGLTVRLCRECHNFLHQYPLSDESLKLKETAQRTAMSHYGWSVEDWMQKFLKDYRRTT